MIFPIKKRQIIRGIAEHVAQGLHPAVDYVASFEPLFNPFSDATISSFNEPEGGCWLQLTRDNGDVIQFAHLSQRFMTSGRPKPGQQIGVTGASGNLTAAGIGKEPPHLHMQIKNAQGVYLDPEQYFTPTNLPIVAINGTIGALQAFQEKLLYYSAGMLTCSWDIVQKDINVLQGLLSQVDAYMIADELDKATYSPYRYVFIFYKGNPTSTFLATYYNPQNDQMLTTAPIGSSPRNLVFEFGHQIDGYFNQHRDGLPPVPYLDSNYPAESVLFDKLRSVLNNTDVLLRHEH